MVLNLIKVGSQLFTRGIHQIPICQYHVFIKFPFLLYNIDFHSFYGLSIITFKNESQSVIDIANSGRESYVLNCLHATLPLVENKLNQPCEFISGRNQGFRGASWLGETTTPLSPCEVFEERHVGNERFNLIYSVVAHQDG